MSKWLLAGLAVASAFEGADAFAAGSTLPSARAAQRSAACSLRMSSEVRPPLVEALFLWQPPQVQMIRKRDRAAVIQPCFDRQNVSGQQEGNNSSVNTRRAVVGGETKRVSPQTAQKLRLS